MEGMSEECVPVDDDVGLVGNGLYIRHKLFGRF